ncbi:MAG: AI-2E family transporter [Patescibacteria group bacterium]
MAEHQGKNLTINISTTTIFKVFLIVGILAILYLLRDVLMIIVVSAILASALNPWVNSLRRRGIPRIVATLFIYVLFFGSFTIVLMLLVPPIATQITDIAQHFPEYYNNVISNFQQFQDFSLQQKVLGNLDNIIQSIESNLGKTSSGIFNAVGTVFGGFFAFIGVVVITFYMLLEDSALKAFIRSVTPVKYQPYVFQLVNRSQDRLRMWLKGQLILSVIIGVLTYIGLTSLGVEYALVLALWAALTEFIPYLGPLLGAIPAVFIALTTGNFVQALAVVVLYIIVQQLENHLIVPKVMQKAVGMNPLVVIILMLIGAKLAGIVGLLLAVPFGLIVKSFAEDFMTSKEEREATLES